MILKTNRLNPIFLFLIVLVSAEASAFSSYDCLRELMPITDRATLQNKRQEVEAPFVVQDKYLVFPEVSNGTVSGFYFYGPKGAAYYDAVDRFVGVGHRCHDRLGHHVQVESLEPVHRLRVCVVCQHMGEPQVVGVVGRHAPQRTARS